MGKMGYLQPREYTMKTHLRFVMITILLYWTLLITPNRAQQENRIEERISTNPSYYYNLCATSVCNNITLIYPFRIPSTCHITSLDPWCASDNRTFYLTSPQSNNTFRVFPANFTTDGVTTDFVMAYNPLFSCGPISKPNYFEGSSPLTLPLDYNVGTHLNCTRPIPAGALQGLQNASCLGCPGQDPNNVCFYAPGLVSYQNCETYYMYTKKGFNVSAEKDLRGYLQRGFEMRYAKPRECRGCEATGGRCGRNPSSSTESFVCFCPSTIHSFNCSDGMMIDTTTWAPRERSGPSKALIAAVSASVSVVFLALLTVAVTLYVFRKDHKRNLKEAVSDMSPTRYSYSQIKKFTNNFSSKLGEGGFGTVYKGTLIQRKGVQVPVAVKLLKSKQSENQFMNEVATVGSVHHQHLVGLLGYCASGQRRALVYEFMEKGSLDKYIYNITEREGGEVVEDKSNLALERLSYKQMYAIALETARGILYLHQGCRNRILHCDIKPQNVLLDSNFTAKVADFGLAKMMDKDHSHVSLTRARGTPGYVAPEMWLKNYGPVTEKSDVYSYGMTLLEMIGGRTNYDLEAEESSQAYFPLWAFNKVKIGESPLLMRKKENALAVIDQGKEGDEAIVERICLVGLWCIQHIPSNRPYMDRVIQMLEGSAEIDIPPNPFPPETGGEF
ncbi:rust resistance kinase Lr10-like [Macadamia integrifolia]|uniref:rust resistance kinase Lr10-like n=1 Tax=Macadamia integrifolia TaxID=60698 RepID=UPI001C4FA6C4|nr:rust resistance kinase Lr10-like [Macadamia integrifolia]